MTDPRLIQAVQELDSGTRALLDLSLRRAIPDERVAGLLGVDLAEIPRRRARGIAQLADKLDVPGPAELALLLVALPDLPEEAWGVPSPSLPKARRLSAARKANAFRRAAVAASPLVAAAAVLAAVLVSSGGGGQKTANLTLTGHLAGDNHRKPAAVAKAPAKADARHALPRGADVASAEGPSPAELTARKARKAAHQRRARRKAHHRHAAAKTPQTVPVSGDHFASSAPRPDAYQPPPKPKHKPQHHTKPKTPATTTPQPTPAPDTQVVQAPPTEPTTTTTPTPTTQVVTSKPDETKKQPLPSVGNGGSDDGQSDSSSSGSGNGGNGGNGGNCSHGHGHGSGDDQGDQQAKSKQSSVFKTRRDLHRERGYWPESPKD